MSNPEVSESLVWAALEPHLETVIDLDLNSQEDNQRFRELVRAVTAVIRSEDEDSVSAFSSDSNSALVLPWFDEDLVKFRNDLSKLPPDSIPEWLRKRPDLLVVPHNVSEDGAQS